MASIAIIPVFPKSNVKARRITENHSEILARLSSYARRHKMVDDTDEADVILFYLGYPLHIGHLDPWRSCLKSDSRFKKYREKSLIMDLDDCPLPFYSGLYNSPDARWFKHSCHRTVAYTHHGYLWDTALEPKINIVKAKYLFSFVGNSSTHSCRKKILRVRDKRALLRDTKHDNPWGDESVKKQWMGDYAKTIQDSKFVLCPRGKGTGSVRVYEVMKAGRVPVVVSDRWVPPRGPDWSACSVRIAENKIWQIPEILEDLESEVEEMGKTSRSEWEAWFSKEVLFDSLVDECLDIKTRCERIYSWERLAYIPYILSSWYQVRRFFVAPVKQALVG